MSIINRSFFNFDIRVTHCRTSLFSRRSNLIRSFICDHVYYAGPYTDYSENLVPWLGQVIRNICIISNRRFSIPSVLFGNCFLLN